MRIVIDIDDAAVDGVFAAVKAETRSGLAEKDLASWLVDWLNQATKRAAVHAAENDAASKVSAEWDAVKSNKIKVGKVA